MRFPIDQGFPACTRGEMGRQPFVDYATKGGSGRSPAWRGGRLRRTLIPAVAGGMMLAGLPMFACGPFFPNYLLDGSDAQILSAPLATFAVEIRKLGLPGTAYPACPSENGRQAPDGRDAELADLRQALSASNLPSEQVNTVVDAHGAEREKLLAYLQERRNWESSFAWISNNAVPPPAFPAIRVVEGLPPEFAGYFRGAVAWHAGDTNAARSAWVAVLELPAAQRRFKSTWAAYMLGRSWEESRPGNAEAYYQSVRHHVDEGMADRLGLAAASLGRQGLMHYRAGDSGTAITLYWQQAAAGDPGALTSLRLTAADALGNRHRSLKSLARDPLSRRVITAYLISSVYLQPVHIDGLVRETAINTLAKIKYFRNTAPNWHRYEAAATLWLAAVEKADLREAEEAELLALAAYQAGEFETAARWLNQAPERNTLALWLRAKLLLREGDVDQAAAALAVIVRCLREDTQAGSERLETASLENHGFKFRAAADTSRRVQDEALGELGALRLVQSEYTEALDALLRAGFWMDAAYVAERILTIEELKTYVERHWPEPDVADVTPGKTPWEDSQWQHTSEETRTLEIRYLLARRLARLGRRTEARSFFPESLRPGLGTWDAALKLGRNEQVPQSRRAAALWTAAQILRTNGMELVGAEVEPDWAVHEGQYDYGVTVRDRTNSLTLPPTRDELARYEAHGVEPEARFHYRDLAADLAWEAAELMPDNTDETANVLNTAGRWPNDVNVADRFYKALVNRCRKTTLGRAADEKRWFPQTGDLHKTIE